jgi:hypothetical protein
MKTIAFHFKNITDLKEYDGDIFKGNINFNMLAQINKKFLEGDGIVINTDICEKNTEKFLDIWGVFYTKIVNVGVGCGD